MESGIILEEWSPVRNIQAFVERTDTTYYFYLWFDLGSANSSLRSTWICNRVKAPKDVDMSELDNGQAPRMPQAFVAHDKKGIEVDSDSLEVVWFEEGDAAALLSDGKILAVIPHLSGHNCFDGYSINAKGKGPFAWEFTEVYEQFEEKVAACKSFWNSYDKETGQKVRNGQPVHVMK